VYDKTESCINRLVYKTKEKLRERIKTRIIMWHLTKSKKGCLNEDTLRFPISEPGRVQQTFP
jgi:hypothetical protein